MSQILSEGKAGSVEVAVRRHGISERTYYARKAKSGGFGLPEVKRLRHFEEENTRPKNVVASQARGKHLLKELLGKDS